MRWFALISLLGCYDHHLLDGMDIDASADARLRDATDARDATARDARPPRDARPDTTAHCEREWTDTVIDTIDTRGEVVVHMHRGGDVDVLFMSSGGLRRAQQRDGAWDIVEMGVTPRFYAFDVNADAVFGYDPPMLVRYGPSGSESLVSDPRFGGMDALWSTATTSGTVLTWRQNLAQLAWCAAGFPGWTCEEESLHEVLVNAHATVDGAGRRVHAGQLRGRNAIEVRWGERRWTVDVPGSASDQTHVRAGIHDARLNVVAFTGGECGVHHIAIASPDDEPVVRRLEGVCPVSPVGSTLALGPSVHVFTRDIDAAYHLELVDGEWVRTPISMASGLDPRSPFVTGASVSEDGWLGWGYLEIRGRGETTVHLLSSAPCGASS